MAVLKLPTSFDDSHYKFSINLSTRKYFMIFNFNNTLQRWVMRLQDEDGNFIFSGRTVKIWAKLLKGADDRLPENGSIEVINLTNDPFSEPTRDDLKENVGVIYFGPI